VERLRHSDENAESLKILVPLTAEREKQEKRRRSPEITAAGPKEKKKAAEFPLTFYPGKKNTFPDPTPRRGGRRTKKR